MTQKNIFIRWAVDFTQWKPTINDLTFACSCIQSEERERLMRFHFRNDFDASLIGRLLIRKFINDVTKIPYEKINIARDSRGKPFLSNNLEGQHIDFNVSHHGSYSIISGVSRVLSTADQKQEEISKNINIGVDIMKFEFSADKSLDRFFRLMTSNFSNSEWKFIKSFHSENDQLKAFKRNWCLKESYVKNVGVGITIDLQKVDFQIKTDKLKINEVITTTKLRSHDNWLFEEHLIDENHCAAISIFNPPQDYIPKKFELLTVDDLLKNAVPLTELDDSYSRKIFCKEYKNNNVHR